MIPGIRIPLIPGIMFRESKRSHSEKAGSVIRQDHWAGLKYYMKMYKNITTKQKTGVMPGRKPAQKGGTMKTYRSPKVSVVIPVFNGAEYLEAAVASVFTSTYRNFEVLLVDDGSSDTSLRICKKLEKKYRRVRFYQFPHNRGLARVLNFALAKAHGKYICRLNQDDLMLPRRIATEVAYLESHRDVMAVGSWIRLFTQDGGKQIVKYLKNDEDIRKLWYVVSPFSDPTVMYRKRIAIKAGGYLQAFWPADDTHLWYRIARFGKLANIQRPLVNVRWHENAASWKHFRKLAEATFAMHNWTDTYIAPASWYIHAYWIIQYMMSMLLPPEWVWHIYRVMKRGIAYMIQVREALRRFDKKIARAKKLASQPATARRSGVYKRKYSSA